MCAQSGKWAISSPGGDTCHVPDDNVDADLTNILEIVAEESGAIDNWKVNLTQSTFSLDASNLDVSPIGIQSVLNNAELMGALGINV